MSKQNIQEIIWDVPEEDVQIGVPVGWEAQFSLNSRFEPVLYRLTTFEEITESIAGAFFYSTDDGNTWVDFPIGDQGKAFYAAYKMRLLVNVANVGYIFAETQGKIYRISADGRTEIENYTVGTFDTSAFEIDLQNNLYLAGQNKTLYKVDTSTILSAGDNSINIHANPLGILIDASRKSFWQIEKNKIALKKLDGSTIFSKNLPIEIDPDEYSSSSSTEILTSSSMSTDIYTSSSTSTGMS